MRGRGKSKDQDETPVVTDGELRSLKKRHKQGEETYTHSHDTSMIQMYGFKFESKVTRVITHIKKSATK